MSSCCPQPSSDADASDIKSGVKDYYGKVLKCSDDLQSNACQTPVNSSMTPSIRNVMSQIHDDIIMKYYGCGICIPSQLKNINIIDVGCGSGRDCYILSKLVGQQGNVIGVDMTDEQLEIANKYVDFHMEKFGYLEPNVKFVKGFIENLDKVGIKDNSQDVVVSNCVVNLCENKMKVLNEIYRILNYGGEFYFSDVYCDRQLSSSIRQHKILWNEGAGGALYWEDLNKFALEAGFEIPRIVSARPFEITKPELKKLIGDAKYVAVVYRLFKLDKVKKTTENKQVIYDGGIDDCEKKFKFDHKLEFAAETPITIDDVTWNIINQSRYSDFFQSKPSNGDTNFIKTEIENPFEVAARGGKSPSCY